MTAGASNTKRSTRSANRTAAAPDASFAARVVMVRQLIALLDRARRTNPDDAIFDVNVAVGAASMIDEPGDIAASRRIDDRAIGQLEAPNVTMLDVPPFA